VIPEVLVDVFSSTSSLEYLGKSSMNGKILRIRRRNGRFATKINVYVIPA